MCGGFFHYKKLIELSIYTNSVIILHKRCQPKIFHLSKNSAQLRIQKKGVSQKFFTVRLVEITHNNMLKPSSRIGCNDSLYSLVNEQTESMTEKFFKESFSPLL